MRFLRNFHPHFKTHVSLQIKTKGINNITAYETISLIKKDMYI
jgi:hypothetical protein